MCVCKRERVCVCVCVCVCWGEEGERVREGKHRIYHTLSLCTMYYASHNVCILFLVMLCGHLAQAYS